MANLKIQGIRILKVIPSDNVDIPDPSKLAVSSTSDAAGLADLNDSTQEFTKTVKVGDIVYDTTNSVAAVVSEVLSDTSLDLDYGVVAALANYKIFSAATTDCVFYVGVAGDMQITSSGGDTEILVAAPAGYHPLNITRVLSTGTVATDIIAIW